MLTIILATSAAWSFQALSDEAELRAIAETIRRASVDHGCDEALFEQWNLVKFVQKDDSLSTLDVGACHIALYSKGAVQLQWDRSRLHLRKLSQTERDNTWSLEQCQDLVNYVLQKLRPGVRWSLARTEQKEETGAAKLTFQGWYGDYLFREPFMGAAQVDIDTTCGRIAWMYVPATPIVLPEDGFPGATETVLRTTAFDAYIGYLPYEGSRVAISEYCVMSPKELVGFETNLSPRLLAIAERGGRLLMYRVIFQRMYSGEPKPHYRYVYVDATTGSPLATHEWAFEAGGLGSKERDAHVGIALDGPVRVAGTAGKFSALDSIEKPEGFAAVQVLVEYQSGAIVVAEFDSAQSLLRIGEKCYRVGPELKASLDASIERRKKLPPWKKGGSPANDNK